MDFMKTFEDLCGELRARLEAGSSLLVFAANERLQKTIIIAPPPLYHEMAKQMQ